MPFHILTDLEANPVPLNIELNVIHMINPYFVSQISKRRTKVIWVRSNLGPTILNIFRRPCCSSIESTIHFVVFSAGIYEQIY